MSKSMPPKKPKPPPKTKAAPKKGGPKAAYEQDETIKFRMFEALRVGMSEGDCAEMLGINTETFRRWKNRDGIGGDIKKAILEGKEHHLRRIFQGAVGWQSSAWFLERKYRSEFGREVAAPAPSDVTVKFESDE
jgi:hypothetical protein